MEPTPEIVIVTGLSGSGKSSVLHYLEDNGFFAIDNFPAPLLSGLANLLLKPSKISHLQKIALVMDAREMSFSDDFSSYFRLLREKGIKVELLYLDADDQVLQRRFSETRRRHPLAPKGRVIDGIQKERDYLHPLREKADHIIDTSHLTVHEMREMMAKFLKKKSVEAILAITLMSFGYRFGLPLESDIVQDLRFLPNPHFVDSLKKKSGLEKSVARYVLDKKITKKWIALLERMFHILLQEYRREGKSHVTISFGCTGGRHRSVAIAEKMARSLKKLGHDVSIIHRDLNRGT